MRKLLFVPVLLAVMVLTMGQMVTPNRNRLANGSVPSGVLTTSVTGACVAADLVETTLWTYNLPANTLNTNGKGLWIYVWGTTDSDADTRTLKLYFGSTTITARGITNTSNNFVIDAIVLRTAATTHTALSNLSVGTNIAVNTGGVEATTPTADTTAAINIKFTGQNTTALGGASNVCFRGAVVQTLF